MTVKIFFQKEVSEGVDDRSDKCAERFGTKNNNETKSACQRSHPDAHFENKENGGMFL